MQLELTPERVDIIINCLNAQYIREVHRIQRRDHKAELDESLRTPQERKILVDIQTTLQYICAERNIWLAREESL